MALSPLLSSNKKRLLLFLSLLNMIKPGSLHYLKKLLIWKITFQGDETNTGIRGIWKHFQYTIRIQAGSIFTPERCYDFIAVLCRGKMKTSVSGAFPMGYKNESHKV
jgi:hypothetical protein